MLFIWHGWTICASHLALKAHVWDKEVGRRGAGNTQAALATAANPSEIAAMTFESNNKSSVLRKQNGSYDRPAILQEAVRQAQAMHTPFLPWPIRLSLCLRGVWETARKAGPPSPRRSLPDVALILSQEAMVSTDVTLSAFAEANDLSDAEARAILRVLKRGGVFWGGGAAVSYSLSLQTEGGVS
jgi:hypothetical protein